jgi:hypothetical protein
MLASRIFLLLTFVPICFLSPAKAQTQASCTFFFFELDVNIPGLGPGFLTPDGVNDFGTIVGAATPSNGQIDPNRVGFIRWSNGGFTFPLGTKNPSGLVHRNNKGITIGELGGMPILLKGNTANSIDFSSLSSQVQSVNGITGINGWGSIVGSYNTTSAVIAFKRWSNGGFAKLRFPGSLSTFPASINDNGTVVGSYFVGQSGVQLPENGFAYHNGQWATVNYPNSFFTHLSGISNAGVIVGNALESVGGFLYENGVFKVILAPDGSPTDVLDISPQLGLILGTTNGEGFVAKCH